MKYKMSFVFDKIINFFKWPMAIYIFFCIPAIINSFNFFDLTNIKTIVLGCGLILFVFSKIMMDPTVRASMQTIAHEFTHTFFALLTFHKIKSIRLNPDDTGGSMGFLGIGNWLIIIGPYFFPLICFIYIFLMNILPYQIIWHAVLGYFLGYHIDTVFSQIHPDQTDLQKVGFPFCILFLPGANLLMIGFILAFNVQGFSGIVKYFNLINNLNLQYFHQIYNLSFELLKGLY